MTTFERVRKNITKDMAGLKAHTPESWVNIMLTNTARLKNEHEQAKFWSWMENPEEDERPGPTLAPCGDFALAPEYVTLQVKDECDEKEGDSVVELQNTFERNGFIMTCRTKPI